MAIDIFLIACICNTAILHAELLRSDGHTVEFMKIPDRNEVELVVHGDTIYSCSVQDLQYGECI